MATADTMTSPPESHSRRRPFTNFMRRLTKRKSPSDKNAQGNGTYRKRHDSSDPPGHPATAFEKITPSASRTDGQNSTIGLIPIQGAGRSLTNLRLPESRQSFTTSADDQVSRTRGAKSIAPTIATNPGTINSDTGKSKAGTVTTGGGTMSTHEAGGDGSTFSSPAPSVRSITTTLTTIQSTAPNTILNNVQPNQGQVPQFSQASQFSQPFPTTPNPASAIPAHVTGGPGHPNTYTTATANNALSDDASILTLASSSKRRRRNSLDTNASVRALAPSSVFGGSRESLPLSVLSSNVGSEHGQGPNSSGGLPRPPLGSTPLGGTAAMERASVYSIPGIVPALTGERSSYYASKQAAIDGGSVRSGLLGHGRNDSVTGSIGGTASPLAATPKELREGLGFPESKESS